ncbi:hypothetical protein DFH08DRAFT_812952 [Mycena albidolilacea]|uniref:Uncharacterized protein n=1 Tax=Mycena albidolilacea TaxID=1033008 RepID=A0AAD6ZTC4_9AGAR|nr:hypothetical protein DFH08DRAFT_812952 [Mycena albidolilacea]
MLQTQLDTYITRSCGAQGPPRDVQPDQRQLDGPARLVQTNLYQWFIPRFPNHDTQPCHSLLRILRDPDVPTGDLSPLLYPEPKNQQERIANIQSVLCRAAQAEHAFRELWNERTACKSFEFNCVAGENDPDYQDRLTETANILLSALYSLKANLGPRALAYVERELTPGGTLRWACRQSGFGYWLSATDNGSPLALLDSIIAAETCETLAAAAATAHDVAADALAEAAHAQLHLQLATNNRAITALIAYRQAEAAHIVALDQASAAQYAPIWEFSTLAPGNGDKMRDELGVGIL